MLIHSVNRYCEGLLTHLLLLLGTQTPPTTRVFLSRPTSLGDAFSLARIIEACYKDERSTTAIVKPTSLILTIGGSQNKASGSSTTPEVAHEVATKVALEVVSESIRETTTTADTVAKIEETVEFYTSELKEHGMKPQNGKSNGVMSVLKDESGKFDDNIDEINLGLIEEFMIRVLEGRDISDEKSLVEDGIVLLMKPQYFPSLILVLVLLLIEEYGIPESISLQDNTLRARWLGRSGE
ncbi:hypothetical protein Tco_1207932 [Tanacetum coccineum]